MSSLGSWGRGINEAATVYVRTAHRRNFYPQGTTAHIRAETSRRILRLLFGPEGTNPCGLTLELAQVIEFGASDPAGPFRSCQSQANATGRSAPRHDRRRSCER